jgi:hypothetical protein
MIWMPGFTRLRWFAPLTGFGGLEDACPGLGSVLVGSALVVCSGFVFATAKLISPPIRRFERGLRNRVGAANGGRSF